MKTLQYLNLIFKAIETINPKEMRISPGTFGWEKEREPAAGRTCLSVRDFKQF